MNPKDIVGAKKAPLGLVPPALVIGAAEAIANGAEKYGSYNWRDYPVQAVTYVEAAMRHLLAYLDGEDDAPDTGISHLKHAVAGLGILLDVTALGTLEDNRPKAGPAAKLLAEQDKTVRVPAPEDALPLYDRNAGSSNLIGLIAAKEAQIRDSLAEADAADAFVRTVKRLDQWDVKDDDMTDGTPFLPGDLT